MATFGDVLVQIQEETRASPIGFMASFAGLDFGKGLDLILHTPGGDVAATESIIDYLRSKFARDIRVIVPQISMSGGTMIALAANDIVMGLHSNLGPIDPQIGGRPAIAILKEFEKARSDITADPKAALLWQPILQQYIRSKPRGRAPLAEACATGRPREWPMRPSSRQAANQR